MKYSMCGFLMVNYPSTAMIFSHCAVALQCAVSGPQCAVEVWKIYLLISMIAGCELHGAKTVFRCQTSSARQPILGQFWWYMSIRRVPPQLMVFFPPVEGI